MAKRDTGLSAFTDTQEEAAKERVAQAHVRTKGTGKVRHVQLRFTSEDQWQRAHYFARSEGVSLNKLALLGISRLMEEKGLPGLL